MVWPDHQQLLFWPIAGNKLGWVIGFFADLFHEMLIEIKQFSFCLDFCLINREMPIAFL